MKLVNKIVLLSAFSLFLFNGAAQGQSATSTSEVKKKDTTVETKSPEPISAGGTSTKIAPKTETDTPIQIVTPPVETIENSGKKDEKVNVKKAEPKK